MSDKMRVAVFASGRGSDFLSLVRASEERELGWEVVLLITNNSEAGAIDKARQHFIPYKYISRGDFEHREDFIAELLGVLDKNRIDLIALAGYLRKIPKELIHRYRHRIINIHPALLPLFGGKGYYGKRVHQAVLEAGCKVSGVTVHFVSEDYDEGRIIAQRCVPVQDDDDIESLSSRVLEVEHQLYPEVVTWFAQNRISIKNNRVMVDENE